MSETKLPLLPDATRNLARFASKLTFEEIPPDVVEKMKLCVLDSIGCCVFGATLPWTRKVADMVANEGGAQIASVFGTGRKTSVSQAVLVNATAGHAFELDDIHKESILHAGSLAFPTALALAEAEPRLSGRDLLTAMIAGYEVGTRIGSAATMSLFFRGFHPQGTSGVFVAAATAGRMLKLDPMRMQHAFGIVGSQAGGLMAAQEGAMVKRFHSGRAAQSGVYSAMLAARDFTGIVDVLEAAYGGYLSSYSDKPNPERLAADLGNVWETRAVGYKPHASVTSIHAALDGLATILREQKLSADDVAAVHVGLSTMTHVHCAWEYKAQGTTAAQMNLHFGLAVMAIDGKAFVEQYSETRLSDPLILSFIRKIEAVIDPEIDALGPAFRHAARVRLTATDGRVFSVDVLNRRGSPENPLSHEDVKYKFKSVAGACLPAEKVEELIRMTEQLERLQSLSELSELLGSKYSSALEH